MPSVSLAEAKALSARAAVGLVREREVLAVGSGSTVELALEEIARRFAEDVRPTVVVASRKAEEVARRVGLRMSSIEKVHQFRLMLDGADEVTPSLSLIKGGGGAHFREKLLARMSENLTIMVDYSKLVRRLGENTPLPLEVVPFALPLVERSVAPLGLSPAVRMDPNASGTPYRTDNGNLILDCRITREPADESALETALAHIPGVVATGLFIGMTSRVLVGMPDGRVEELLPGEAPVHGTLSPVVQEAISARRALAKTHRG